MSAIAKITYLRAWTVLVLVGVVVVAAAVIAFDVFDRVDPFDISDSGSEVERAYSQIEDATGQSADPAVILLIEPGEDVPAAEDTLSRVDGIAAVVGPAEDPALTDGEGRSLVVAYLEPGANRVDTGEDAETAFEDVPGILAGGTAVAAHQVGVRSEDDSRRIELLAAPLLFVLLLIVFRTFVAALLPLLVAGVTIGITFAALRLLTGITQIDLFSLQVVSGLGVGLAIDYSLFVIARFREEIRADDPADDGEPTAIDYRKAHMRTLQTAGRTVAFSALTVAASLAALTVFPQPFLHSTGIAGALTAIFAGLTSLLALPAVLALLGPSINRFAVRRDPLRHGVGARSGFWQRFPALVCRVPIVSIVLGAAIAIALAIQVGGVELTTPDARELPAADSARVVAEAMNESFPEVPMTQLHAVVPGDAGALEEKLEALPTVTAVAPPQPLDDGASLIQISSSADPLSGSGQDLVDEVRDELPDGSAVGGRAAELTDQRASIRDHAPEALLILLVTNLLLVALMTRSLVLPLLAVAMNLLVVAAALGAMAAIFTTGWCAGLLGTDEVMGIDISVPVLAFAVAFGLSTDYGIFLLSRIREARASAESEREAIIEGVASSGRLITASAVLLAIAVGAFAFSDLVIIKEFAVAIAVAVLLDATVIRGLLIPAFLRILGGAAWWPWGGKLGAGDVAAGGVATPVPAPDTTERH
ncbi:MAG: MMPL family transporter [Solirubrobacterales bacterium]